ncbi:carbohydrate-binding-like fold [Wolffia australiana]
MAVEGLLPVLLILLFATSVAADSIHGCGGFVQASPALIQTRKSSDARLDYSHITVELRTVDGLLKDSTQCAPNGYYFIPVYDKGSFIIRAQGPVGWSWEPEKVSVVIDQSGCNANADINFQFTGFMISGKVTGTVGGESCAAKNKGPRDVKIELFSSSDEPVSSVMTSETGTYAFSNIIPGVYKLRASHPNLEIEYRGPPEVNLGFGNAQMDDVFIVSGYEIQGSVMSQGNPILGVHIYLYSEDVSEVNCPEGSGKSPGDKKALCHTISDADGKFKFKSIPCGRYELLPFYSGENNVFDVSPPSLSVSVEQYHTSISQPFQVTGFSVGGRVVDDKGSGIDKVKIMVDNQLKATTDVRGFYKLDQVTSKRYRIAAEKEHYKFSSLENYLVLPNMTSLEDVKAVGYDVCGVVRFIDAKTKAKVSLTHGIGNVKPQAVETDESGNFCFEVPPGEYRLSALAMKSQRTSRIQFSPQYVDVMVNKPVLNVEFLQAQVNIYGNVVPKDKCSSLISVALSRLDGRDLDDKKTIHLNEASCDFVFSKVFPGKYQIQVKHEGSTGAEDNWCWEKRTFDIDVGVEDKKGVVFVQEGYWMTISSTHDADAFIRQPDAATRHLKVKTGSQKICLQNPGVHELHFVNACVSFGNSSFMFDTSYESTLNLIGDRYLVRGEIHIPSTDYKAFGPSDFVAVDVTSNHRVGIDTIDTKWLSRVDDGTDELVLEYSTWASVGEELNFVPQHKRNDGKETLLFYPRDQHVSVISDQCQPAIRPFIGRKGLYIEGSVSPALSGVYIRIIAMADSINAPLLKGGTALETVTKEDGSFVGGPLYDDTAYEVEASKPGYHVKRLEGFTFSCQKLGKILVNMYDREEAQDVFPSVLLSLSGEDGYRNNSVTGIGGRFVFDNLFPGSFYLRPLLKEYSFSPSAVSIDLESGESKSIVFFATRVAYSALGKVSLLSGQPKGGLHVEARSESRGHYEETTSDNFGNYRLRGLLPDTAYVIKVTSGVGPENVDFDRASPASVTVHVGNEDVKGLDFVVFEYPEITILTGHVEGENLKDLQPHLSIEVRSAADPSKIEMVVPLPLSHFFQINDLPKQRHLLQLMSRSQSSTHKFMSDVLEVDLERRPQVHVGPLIYRLEEYRQKQELTPAPVFPLVVGLSVIALFVSIPRLKDLYQYVVEFTQVGSSPASGKKDTIRKPILKRRAS